MGESSDTHHVTRLIQLARDGDAAARNELYESIYDELRRLAQRAKFVGRAGDTMQGTVLVSEVYLALERRFPPPPQDQHEDRNTFYLTVATAMRSILRDHWKGKNRKKRGGGDAPLTILDGDKADTAGTFDQLDYLALDEAMVNLRNFNRRWHDVVMLRFFAGRSIRQTAELLGIADSSVKTDWKLAKSWLQRALQHA